MTVDEAIEYALAAADEDAVAYVHAAAAITTALAALTSEIHEHNELLRGLR